MSSIASPTIAPSKQSKIGATYSFPLEQATYVAVKELAELTSEGERIGIGETPPTITLQLNARGESVVELQFLLNFVAEFYPSIFFVIENGVFREDTTRGVIEFQKEFGLTQDGVVGPATWRKLYDVYRATLGMIITPPIIEPQTPSYPGSSLRLGSRSSDVLLMQNYINAIAKTYSSIPTIGADGIFGTATQTSVTEFQKQFGLVADDIIGKNTWDKIVIIYNNLPSSVPQQYPGTSLRIGSRGNDVLVIQKYLSEIMVMYPYIPALTADGIFGEKTHSSVIAFQKQFGLVTDGVVGKNTWNKLISVYNALNMNSDTLRAYSVRSAGHKNNDLSKYALLALCMYGNIRI